MTPTALAGETARASNPDSTYACASANVGSTPIEIATWRTIVCIFAREGTVIAFKAALFWLAAAVVPEEYV